MAPDTWPLASNPSHLISTWNPLSNEKNNFLIQVIGRVVLSNYCMFYMFSPFLHPRFKLFYFFHSLPLMHTSFCSIICTWNHFHFCFKISFGSLQKHTNLMKSFFHWDSIFSLLKKISCILLFKKLFRNCANKLFFISTTVHVYVHCLNFYTKLYLLMDDLTYVESRSVIWIFHNVKSAAGSNNKDLANDGSFLYCCN